MTSEKRHIEQLYYEWLGAQVDDAYADKTNKRYTHLWRVLNDTEFVWTVPNDDNRASDALDLRAEFINLLGSGDIDKSKGFVAYHHARLDGPPSLVEVIIALSRHMAFNTENTSAAQWAWQLIENLGWHRLANPIGPKKQARLEDDIEALLFRTYNPDGHGGFFPLGFPTQDQRKVELWYQMCAYLEEQFTM